MSETRSVLVRKEDVEKTLSIPSEQGKRLLEPLKTFAKEHSLPLNILEDNNVENEAEIHTHEDDLWMCLEGEVTFVYGGRMVNPWFKKNADGTEDQKEMKAKEISGGKEVLLKAGDWLYIPAGEPHSHRTKGVARLVIIKIPKRPQE